MQARLSVLRLDCHNYCAYACTGRYHCWHCNHNHHLLDPRSRRFIPRLQFSHPRYNFTHSPTYPLPITAAIFLKIYQPPRQPARAIGLRYIAQIEHANCNLHMHACLIWIRGNLNLGCLFWHCTGGIGGDGESRWQYFKNVVAVPSIKQTGGALRCGSFSYFSLYNSYARSAMQYWLPQFSFGMR